MREEAEYGKQHLKRYRILADNFGRTWRKKKQRNRQQWSAHNVTWFGSEWQESASVCRFNFENASILFISILFEDFQKTFRQHKFPINSLEESNFKPQVFPVDTGNEEYMAINLMRDTDQNGRLLKEQKDNRGSVKGGEEGREVVLRKEE